MNEELKTELEKYFSNHKLVKYKKGDVILTPGERPKFVGFIKSGYVRMYSITENGVEVTAQFFKPILYLTVIYAFTKIENKYYFEAITPVEIYKAPVADTLSYFEENRSVAMELMNYIMVLMMGVMDNCSFLLAGNAYNKVAKMVMDLSHKKETEEGKNDFFGVTHKLIASLTGLTRETVTLQMLKLEKEGIIENKNKRVFVHDWEKLEEATRSEAK